MVNPSASASASSRVTNALRRRSRSCHGRACARVALTNEPTPRRVSSTPARSLAVHARDRVRIDAEIDCELPNRRQLITSTEASCGNRRSQPPL